MSRPALLCVSFRSTVHYQHTDALNPDESTQIFVLLLQFYYVSESCLVLAVIFLTSVVIFDHLFAFSLRARLLPLIHDYIAHSLVYCMCPMFLQIAFCE